jgi:hypothetical protein
MLIIKNNSNKIMGHGGPRAVIPAIEDAEIRRMAGTARHGQKVSKGIVTPAPWEA